MIEEIPQRLGRWSLTLRDDTPVAVSEAVTMFGHMCVCPTRLERGATSATILAAARYSGVMRRRASRTQFEGVNLAHWLGDEDGKGALITTGTGGSGLSKRLDGATGWVDWVTQTNYLTVGTVKTDATTNTLVLQYIDRRTAMDIVCDVYDVEWRVNADGTVDVNDVDTLYGATPSVIFTGRGDSRDTALTGVDVIAVDIEIDVEDYSSEVIVADNAGTYATAGGASTYYNLLGNSVKVSRIIDGTASVPAASASAFATTQLGRFDSPRRQFTVDADEFDISGRVEPGVRAWVYDPATGLTDTANEVNFGGRTIHPLEVRVRALSWPIETGMGVYFLGSDSAQTVTDLTDWFVPERGRPRIEVGAVGRRLDGGEAR